MQNAKCKMQNAECGIPQIHTLGEHPISKLWREHTLPTLEQPQGSIGMVVCFQISMRLPPKAPMLSVGRDGEN